MEEGPPEDMENQTPSIPCHLHDSQGYPSNAEVAHHTLDPRGPI